MNKHKTNMNKQTSIELKTNHQINMNKTKNKQTRLKLRTKQNKHAFFSHFCFFCMHRL